MSEYTIEQRMVYRQLVGFLPDAEAEDLRRVAQWILDMLEDERNEEVGL